MLRPRNGVLPPSLRRSRPVRQEARAWTILCTAARANPSLTSSPDCPSTCTSARRISLRSFKILSRLALGLGVVMGTAPSLISDRSKHRARETPEQASGGLPWVCWPPRRRRHPCRAPCPGPAAGNVAKIHGRRRILEHRLSKPPGAISSEAQETSAVQGSRHKGSRRPPSRLTACNQRILMGAALLE
jgi:hypothetical protein